MFIMLIFIARNAFIVNSKLITMIIFIILHFVMLLMNKPLGEVNNQLGIPN